MRISLNTRAEEAFGLELAEFWRRYYRLGDRGRPGWVSYAELKNAVSACEFAGGDGSTPQEAVAIGRAPTPLVGEFAELVCLSSEFGVLGQDWFLGERMAERHCGRVFDRVVVRLPDGTERERFFDTSGFGPWL